MRGLDPRIHPPFARLFRRKMDGRVKPGHDAEKLIFRHYQVPSWRTCAFPMRIALAGAPALGHSSVQAAQPGGRCSQGGVKVPTGGKGDEAQARERLPRFRGRVSRFGVIPKPTVKVRMKENGRDSRISARRVVPYALILVLKRGKP